MRPRTTTEQFEFTPTEDEVTGDDPDHRDVRVSDALQGHHRSSIGELRVSKGTTPNTGLRIMSWDAIHPCEPACRAYDICKYEKGGRCRLMKDYLTRTEAMIIHNFEEQLDEPALYRIGMHLMPLYHMLCRFKIEEIGFNRAVYTTDKGNYKANPVFKEIRETLKQIEAMWRGLDLDTPLVPVLPVPNPADGPQRNRNVVPMMTGNGKSYYSRLEGGHVPKTRRIVRRRVNGSGD